MPEALTLDQLRARLPDFKPSDLANIWSALNPELTGYANTVSTLAKHCAKFGIRCDGSLTPSQMADAIVERWLLTARELNPLHEVRFKLSSAGYGPVGDEDTGAVVARVIAKGQEALADNQKAEAALKEAEAEIYRLRGEVAAARDLNSKLAAAIANITLNPTP
jgi:hypothetical protein